MNKIESSVYISVSILTLFLAIICFGLYFIVETSEEANKKIYNHELFGQKNLDELERDKKHKLHYQHTSRVVNKKKITLETNIITTEKPIGY